MFHFPAFPPHTLYIQVRVTAGNKPDCRVTPFGHPRITARLATPRGLSQPPTSFIGSWCQGIHHALLVAWPQRCSRPLCSSQTTNNPTTNPHLQAPTKTTGTHGLWSGRLVIQKKQPRPPTQTPRHAEAAHPNRHVSWQMARGPFPQDPTGCTRTPPTHPEPDPHPHPPNRGRKVVLESAGRRRKIRKPGSTSSSHAPRHERPGRTQTSNPPTTNRQ
jgi:hypothetical protein